MEEDVSVNTSRLIYGNVCNSNVTWFFVLSCLTIVLLSLLIAVVCILAYFVYRLRQQTDRFLPSLPDEREMIYAFSNKHAELMEYRASAPASSGSIADPWNTRSEQCDCQLIHKEGLNRRYNNIGVQFHTYPKVNTTKMSSKWTKRVFSQPVTLNFRPSQLSLMREERNKVNVPKNRMVERLLMEAGHQEYAMATRQF